MGFNSIDRASLVCWLHITTISPALGCLLIFRGWEALSYQKPMIYILASLEPCWLTIHLFPAPHPLDYFTGDILIAPSNSTFMKLMTLWWRWWLLCALWAYDLLQLWRVLNDFQTWGRTEWSAFLYPYQGWKLWKSVQGDLLNSFTMWKS
jgi:hypothetical protein